jgi:hypothetical protein
VPLPPPPPLPLRYEREHPDTVKVAQYLAEAMARVLCPMIKED